jgi:hypothetical protein
VLRPQNWRAHQHTGQHQAARQDANHCPYNTHPGFALPNGNNAKNSYDLRILRVRDMRKWSQEEVREMPRKSASETAATTARKARKTPATKSGPSHDEIALRAYYIYLQRNGAPGSPFDDWKQAEQELLAEAGAKPKTRARKSKVVPFAA